MRNVDGHYYQRARLTIPQLILITALLYVAVVIYMRVPGSGVPGAVHGVDADALGVPADPLKNSPRAGDSGGALRVVAMHCARNWDRLRHAIRLCPRVRWAISKPIVPTAPMPEGPQLGSLRAARRLEMAPWP